MEENSAASELSPSPFSSSQVPPVPSESEPKRTLGLTPKFPVFKRSSTKTTPFILKRVSVCDEAGRLVRPEQTSSSASGVPSFFFSGKGLDLPTVISPVSIATPSRPRVISPVTASSVSTIISPISIPVPKMPAAVFPISAVSNPISQEEPVPFAISPISVHLPCRPRVVSPVSIPMAVSMPLPERVSEIQEVLSSSVSAASSARIPAVNPRISLHDISREFARERVRADKTRRRRFRSPLVNGEIREELKDEYYWEILPPESESGKARAGRKSILHRLPPKEGSGLVSSGERWEPNLLTALMVEPIVFVGHTTLWVLGPFLRLAKGSEGMTPLPEEMNRPLAQSGGKKRGFRSFDLLVAVICGVTIAALVVYPLIQMFGTEIYRAIRLSNVRKFSNSVAVTEETPSLLQILLDPPEILGEFDGHLLTPASRYSNIGYDDNWAEEPDPSLWQEGMGTAEFDGAQWSGALLNEFESPETESDRSGE